jgi:hypothetical protein
MAPPCSDNRTRARADAPRVSACAPHASVMFFNRNGVM